MLLLIDYFRRLLRVLLLLGIVLFPLNSLADTEQRDAALLRIQVTLSQLNPLITMAEKSRDKQIQQYVNFKALRGDINKIKQGIDNILHPAAKAPRIVEPLVGDYLTHNTNVAP